MPQVYTDTAEGAELGMVTARAAHELREHEVAYLQDMLVNQPGLIRRRGAIQGATAITAANIDSMIPSAICTVFDPAGVQKVGVVYFKDTGAVIEVWLAVFDSSLTFLQKHQIGNAMNTTLYPARPAIVSIVPGLDGSILISVRGRYDRNVQDHNFTVKWYGSSTPASTRVSGAVLTATIAATLGSVVVTGGAAEIAKLAVGTVIPGTGVVQSIDSTTQVSLISPSAQGYAATGRIYQVVEGLGVVRARGEVSAAVGATSVTGFDTKFSEAYDQATTQPGDWSLIDPVDNIVIATHVTGIGVSSDTLLGGVAGTTAVTRNASLRQLILEISKSGYVRLQGPNPAASVAYTPYSVKGSMWAAYKDYLLSFNGLAYNVGFTFTPGENRVSGRAWIHGPRLPEIMDHTVADGNWFPVNSTKYGDDDGIATIGGRNACVLCKQQETWAMEGNTPDDFNMVKIADDGALSCESVATYQGDVLWMGKTGIWRFDGSNVPVNILKDTLGDTWNTLVAPFDTKSLARDSNNMPLNQARCFVYRDHLFVNITNTGSQQVVYTDGVARTQQSLQLMIYLPTGAVSMLSNFNFAGFAQIGRAGYTLLAQNGSTTHYIFPLDNLFVQGVATTDAILTTNVYNSGSVATSVGPWSFIESRKFNEGDGLWKKSWKQLATLMKLTSTKRVFLETVPGLESVGTRAALPYVGTGAYLAARVKFRVRDRYMSFRLYEDIANRPATMSLGPWQWAYKNNRRGAV